MAAVGYQRGFVLIEMVLVLGLIAVLLSVLLPGYQQYVWQSHRREASQELLKLANLQQLLFAEQSRYSDDLTEFGFSDSEYFAAIRPVLTQGQAHGHWLPANGRGAS